MTLLKVLGFSLCVLLSYTMFANILPQVQSDPPVEEVIEVGSMDMAGMVAWGERLFSGKGTCVLCHNNLGRAPDILNLELGTVLPARIAAEAYDGEAKPIDDGAVAVEVYLRESMIEPSAYVVPGFGKKGTADKVSPMPNVNGPPIDLLPTEMNALIAFLQDRSGFDPTVDLPTDDQDGAAEDDEEDDEIAATAVDVVNKYACSACHDLEGSEADGGPKLNGLASRMDRAAIRNAILDPNATIAVDFEADVMPQDFGEQMRVSELELLINYLSALPK